jgi:Fic family protein
LLEIELIILNNQRMTYNWQQNDWRDFRYDISGINDLLVILAEKKGRIGGIIQTLPQAVRIETVIGFMVTEAVKTSEIEGEYIARDDVMSSIRNQLGLNEKPIFVKDKRAKGIAEMMLAIRDNTHDPLTDEMLFAWHKMLMQGNTQISLGMWRTHTEAMQIVSNVLYEPIVHFEAPPSDKIPDEMHHFIKWFNDTAPNQAREIKNPVIRSAIAHIYFESIHPFEDGNGRIGRAISEKALAQSLEYPVLFSISKAIEQKKKDYYNALENAQKSNDLTDWIYYFTNMVLETYKDTELLIHFVLQKSRFFDCYDAQMDVTHKKVINRMLEEGYKGFEGGMNARKYCIITGVSKATATRHLHYLTQIGAFIQEGMGRSTRYHLNINLNNHSF